MSQVLITLVTWVSLMPDAAKSAFFIFCELFVAAIVVSPFVSSGTRRVSDQSNLGIANRGSKGACT